MTPTYSQIVQKKKWSKMFIENKMNTNTFSRSWGEKDRQTDRQTEGERGHRWNKSEPLVNPVKR